MTEYHEGQDNTIDEIRKLLKAYSIDSFRMVSLADDIISRQEKQTQKGLGDLAD